MQDRTPLHPGNKQSRSGADAWEDEAEVDDFKPLTHDEVRQWRKRQPPESVWRVVWWQAVLAALAALLAWGLTRRAAPAWSALYGGLCIVLPSALMAYGLTSSALARIMARMFPGVAKVALVGVLFWEGIKVLLVLTLLWLAPRLVPGLNWLALVGGLVVALKAYWLEFWMRSRRAA
jgi:ATP synthase protein I